MHLNFSVCYIVSAQEHQQSSQTLKGKRTYIFSLQVIHPENNRYKWKRNMPQAHAVSLKQRFQTRGVKHFIRFKRAVIFFRSLKINPPDEPSDSLTFLCVFVFFSVLPKGSGCQLYWQNLKKQQLTPFYLTWKLKIIIITTFSYSVTLIYRVFLSGQFI